MNGLFESYITRANGGNVERERAGRGKGHKSLAQDDWFTSGYFPAINTLDGTSYTVFSLTIFGESTLNKITATYDINASAVSFTPSKKMDIFLVPSLPYMRGRVRYIDGATTYDQQLNDFFHLYDRSIFLNSAHPLYGIGSTRFTTDQGLGTTYNATAFSKWTAITDHLKDHPSARARYSTDNQATWPTSDDGTNFGAVISPGYSPGQVPTNTSVFSSLLASNTAGFLGNPINQTRLRCVIYQGGQYYYVWNVAYT